MDTKLELNRAEILDWRNNERLDLVQEIKARMPDIDAKIDALIDDMSIWDTIRRSQFHNSTVAPAVESWLQDVMVEFRRDIETSAKESERDLGHDPEFHNWSWNEIGGAGAASLLTLAPLAVVPFAASIATVTVPSLFVFSTSAISLPILSGVIGGTLIAGAAGEKFRRNVFNKISANYRKQVKQNILNKALGDPENLEAHSVCRSLLVNIDVIALKRLENLQ